jgi:hypothetical protein
MIGSDNDKVHLYVDGTNIFRCAQATAAYFGDPEMAMRLHAEHLRAVMAAGREVASATLVANVGVPEAVRRHFERCFDVITVEFGTNSGSEQAADEVLQNRLLLNLWRSEPGVAVVATGDGAGWAHGIGFTQALVAARERGFGIEVLAFRAGLNPRLRLLAESSGCFVELDAHYRSITFLEGLRSAEAVNLRHRPTAEPHPWTAAEAAVIRPIFGFAPEGRAA